MDIVSLLDASSATAEFRADALSLATGKDAGTTIRFRAGPRVKVLRVVAQLLSAEPELVIQGVMIEGWSGCSDFRGRIAVDTPDGVREFDFVWCCKWRALEEGWVDYFGFPDQMRAAREFDWRCFQSWRERSAVPA